MEQDLRDRIEIERTHCPYCREGLKSDDSKVGCEACMAWQHRECAQTHGACVSCGHELAGITSPTPRAPGEAERSKPLAPDVDKEVRAVEAVWAMQREQSREKAARQKQVVFGVAIVFVAILFMLVVLLVN